MLKDNRVQRHTPSIASGSESAIEAEFSSHQKRELISEKSTAHFQGDYSIYADRGSNCVDWS